MKWLKFFIGAPLLRSVTFTTQTQIWYGSSKIKKKPPSTGRTKGQTENAPMEEKLGAKKRLESPDFHRRALLRSVREPKRRNSSWGDCGDHGKMKNTHEKKSKNTGKHLV